MNTTTAVGEKPTLFGKIVLYFILVAGAVLSVYPLYWMAVIATNSNSAVYQVPPKLWFGDKFITNFNNVLDTIVFWGALWNSFVVSGLTTLSVLFFCSLAGYAFAKFHFPGRRTLFVFVLATLVVPPQLNLLPNYMIMAKLGWIDSYKAIVVPGMVTAFGIFWMRQYIEAAVHSELLESGRIDGASHFRIFWTIVLPIIVPALATLGIFTFMNVWNDFMWPLIVLKSSDKYTIQVTLSQLNSLRDGIDYGKIMAGTFVATLPVLIVFSLFSRWFISGLTQGAIKS